MEEERDCSFCGLIKSADQLTLPDDDSSDRGNDMRVSTVEKRRNNMSDVRRIFLDNQELQRNKRSLRETN